MTSTTTASSEPSTSKPSTSNPSTSTELLDAFSDHAASVAERVGPAVVSLGRNHRASGVVIAPNTVLTNSHNLADRTTQVTFADGRVVQGSVRAGDPAGDLVVLDVDTADVEPVTWAATAPSTGRVVFALAGSHSGPRISFGIVSATGRSFRGPGGRPIAGSVEHTAPLPRGSSGGPLVDADGHLVGINTHRPSAGLYLARPVDATLRQNIEQLQAGTSVRPVQLGVALAPPEIARRMRAAVGLDDRDGLLVRGVVEGSAAGRAGVRSGDLLVSVGDTSLTSVNQLFEVLGSHDTSGALQLSIVRGQEELTVSVSFAEDAPTEEGQA